MVVGLLSRTSLRLRYTTQLHYRSAHYLTILILVNIEQPNLARDSREIFRGQTAIRPLQILHYFFFNGGRQLSDRPPCTNRLTPNYSHQTRRDTADTAPLLHVPFRRTTFGKRSFSSAAPSVWNSLPPSVLNSSTLTLFKSRLKTCLLSSVFITVCVRQRL